MMSVKISLYHINQEILSQLIFHKIFSLVHFPWTACARCALSTVQSEGVSTESRQKTEQQTRTFDPTNESADCWSARQSICNFIIKVK